MDKIVKPRISVLMPVYNAALYLRQAIESILNQTYSDFEYIIINDGSSDNSLSIIEEYAQGDKRIKVISRENKGLVYSLNEGIELAQGEYIARMDADDISINDRFQIQLDAILDQNVDVIGGWRGFIGGFHDSKIEEYAITDSDIKFRMLLGCPLAHPTVFAKSIVFKQNPYQIPVNKYGSPGFSEDYELWTRLAIKGYKFANVPKVLLLYRISPTQYTQEYSDRQKESAIKISAKYGSLKYGIPIEQTNHFGWGVKNEGQRGKLEEYVNTLLKIADKSGVSKRWLKIILFETFTRMTPSFRDSVKLLNKLFVYHREIIEIRILIVLLFKIFPHIENVKVRKKLVVVARHLGVLR